MTKSFDRLMSKINKTSDCWEWTGTIGIYGYGKIYIDGKHKRAHRAVYEALVGEIPEGLVLDHLCEVKSCVNPIHLEPVTPKENILRCKNSPAYLNSIKTHCLQGHEFDEKNTYHKKDGNGKRACRKCQDTRTRAYLAKQKKVLA